MPASTTPPEKKSRSKRIEDAYEGSARAIEQAAATNAAAVQGAYDAYNQETSAANDALMQSRQAGRTALQQSLDEGMSAYDAIFQEADKRLKNERQEGQDQVKADQNAAAVTGYAELAASLANLIGVGGHNAVSQTYRPYSQDWMRKADADRRAHQMRMDNLRERQRTIQQHMVQMKMNGTGQMANYDNETAGLAHKGAAERAKGKLSAAITAAGINAQGAQGAAAQRAQGAVASINTELREADAESVAAARRENTSMQAARYGLKRNPDGSYSLDATSPVARASLKAGAGRGGGGSKNTLYYYGTGGDLVEVHMTTAEYNDFVEQSYATVKDDPDFKKAYRRAQTETEKKSVIYQFACQNDERRRVLSQYGDNPEAWHGAAAADQRGDDSDYMDAAAMLNMIRAGQ